MSRAEQSFENHARMVPLYHYATALLLVVPLAWFLYRAWGDFSLDRVALVLLTLAVAGVYYFAREFPLGVQDRVIRLEERLRLAELLPDDLRARIPMLTTDQLIALRFASDTEVVELARRVLDEGLTDRTAIKRLVREWRPDHQRI